MLDVKLMDVECCTFLTVNCSVRICAAKENTWLTEECAGQCRALTSSCCQVPARGVTGARISVDRWLHIKTEC